MLHRTTIESLLNEGFIPTRTVVLAFGIDEESAGTQVSYVIVSMSIVLSISKRAHLISQNTWRRDMVEVDLPRYLMKAVSLGK